MVMILEKQTRKTENTKKSRAVFITLPRLQNPNHQLVDETDPITIPFFTV